MPASASSGYAAVRTNAGIARRDDLAVLRLWGRDPLRMLHGLITNDLLNAAPGRAVYGAMLTPKGRMIAELRVHRGAPGGEPELLVEVPRAALAGATEQLRKSRRRCSRAGPTCRTNWACSASTARAPPS